MYFLLFGKKKSLALALRKFAKKVRKNISSYNFRSYAGNYLGDI